MLPGMPVIHPHRPGPNPVRLGETIRVLSRWGLGARLLDHAPEWLSRHVVAPDGQLVAGRSDAERLRLALEELGPIYIKLGQLLSVSGVLPAELEASLTQLQQHGTPLPIEDVVAAIEAELGAPIDELFTAIEPEPLGVASIAQVHAATLPDGTRVAVKVQKPGIERTVHEDLDIITSLAGVVEDRLPGAAPFRPRDLAAQFRRRTLAELDYRREAGNSQRFAEAFHDEGDVHFPHVVAERSGARVLTLELMEGATLGDTDAEAEALDTAAFARRTAELWLTMIFRDGFVHADPHPGNIFVQPGGRIGVIDCGMVLRVDAATRSALAALGSAAARRDAEALTTTLLAVCDHPPVVDREALGEDVERMLATIGGSSGSIPLTDLVGQLRAVVRTHGLVIPARLNMLAQVAGELEGTARSVDPGFHIMPALESVVRRVTEHNLRPEALLARGEAALRSLTLGGRHPLRDLRGLVDRLSEGDFGVTVRHSDADESVDRLTYGLLAAALLVGAPIVWHADPPPHRNGVSVVGAGMTAASVAMAGELVLRIRRGRGKPSR
jgi:ubiquinone biosynthesis protein